MERSAPLLMKRAQSVVCESGRAERPGRDLGA